MLTHNGEPIWVFSLRYEVPQRYPAKRGRKTAKELRAELNAEEQRRFDLVYSWRNQKGKQSGQPPFIYFSNQQLFDLIKQMPQGLVALSKIRGLGPNKIKSFGEELLTILHQDGELKTTQDKEN